MTTTETTTPCLHSAVLALWPQWRDADGEGRRKLREQYGSDTAGTLDRLQQNLRTAGNPAEWFGYATASAQEETILPGAVAAVLRGLTVSSLDVEEFARVLRISGSARRQLFIAAVRAHQPDAAPTSGEIPQMNAAPAPDPFSPEHPCQKAPLEIPEMSNNGTTPSNGRHGRSGVEALITTPGTASVREMVSVAVEALGIDLSKELTNETREAIARRASQ